MKIDTAFFVVILSFVLSGCEQAKQTLGFTRNKNDEFEILTTAHLSLPQDYQKLPEPKNKKKNIAGKTRNQAKVLALGQLSHKNKEEVPKKEAGEAELLKRVKTEERDPDIRQIIDDESRSEEYTAGAIVRKILPFGESQPGRIIDPTAEKQRLEKDKKKDEK